MRWSGALACGLPWGLVTVETGAIYFLVRQHGRLLLGQDALQERLDQTDRTVATLSAQLAALQQLPAVPAPTPAPQPAALSLGSPAPAFALPDLDGRQRSMAEFLGQPVLLVFFNTGCGFCLQMAPQLGQVSAEGQQVLLIGSGDPSDYRRLTTEHGWRCQVLLDASGQTMAAYRAPGTPMGYLLDAEGHIASGLAAGADAVLGLLAPAAPLPVSNGHVSTGQAGELTAASLRAKEHAATEQARAAGLAVRESTLNRQGLPAGTKAPGFQLPDLQGTRHSLAEYRGKPVLLVFSDPDCGPCQALAPDLVKLQREQGDQLQVVMVSKGELAANVAKVKEHGLPFPVLLQPGWQVSKEYAMFATPIGYLIDEQGVIARDVAVGGEAIMQLAQGVVAIL